APRSTRSRRARGRPAAWRGSRGRSPIPSGTTSAPAIPTGPASSSATASRSAPAPRPAPAERRRGVYPSTMRRSGRHFLQIPGPTNVPDRVLRAIDRPTIDHRGPEFARLATEIFDGLRAVVGTRGPVVIFPSSGTGAWEAAIVNTLRPGDKVLMFETGHFA